eukprot:c8994_g1_i2.p1 GENE.c8994_g1_i2~~c8994_g1_i2.p1  ORF type:complete len:392 (+),score=163.00 c8994_g1_i2:44-1219(+)
MESFCYWLRICLLAAICISVKGYIPGGQNLGLPLAFPSIPFDKCIVSSANDISSETSVFSWGYNNEYWTTKQSSGSFGTWKSIGGYFAGGPTAIRNANNNIVVFGRGSDKQVWTQTISSENDHSSWISLGGNISSHRISALLDPQGFIYIFARGQDGSVWQKNQISNGTEAIWADWVSLGGHLTSDITSLIDNEGIIHLFARGIDGLLWNKTQKLDVNGTLKWSDWGRSDPSVFLNPSAVISAKLNSQNLIEVVVRGSDKSFWHVRQEIDQEKGVSWSSFQSLGGIFSSAPSIESNLDGLLTIFGRGPENGVWQKQQLNNPESEIWGPWTPVGGRFDSSVNLITNNKGEVNIFGCGVDDSIWVRSQSTINHSVGFFGNWTNLGGRFRVFPC